MRCATSQLWIPRALLRHSQMTRTTPGWQVHAVQQQPSAAVLPLPRECSTLHCLPLPSGVHRPQ